MRRFCQLVRRFSLLYSLECFKMESGASLMRSTSAYFGTSAYKTRLAWVLMVPLLLSSTLSAQTNDIPGRLSRESRRALSSGKTSAQLPPARIEWAEPESLTDALKRCSVVVAKLENSAVGHDADDIFTWRKYRIIEQLSVQPYVTNDPLPSEIPRSLLPLRPGEFLIPELGGTSVVNGVNISEANPQEAYLPKGSVHLMFLIFKASGAIALPNYGPVGMFSIDNSEHIEGSIDSEQNPFRSEVLRSTGGTLQGLRDLAPASSHDK